MTRVITLAALTCVLVAGAAISALMNWGSTPAVPLAAAAVVNEAPVSNAAMKQDKLTVTTTLTAADYAPAPSTAPSAMSSQLLLRAQANIPGANLSGANAAPAPDTLRQAYASAEPADIGLPRINDSVGAIPAAPAAVVAPKPKAVAKPAPQKSYALLSDAQIAGIKERLKLSAAQESYWPAVETALRAVARKLHAKRQGDLAAGVMPIDPDSEEVQQLKSAAMPLLFQLREDQKNEVRSLARLIGLDKVAAMI